MIGFDRLDDSQQTLVARVREAAASTGVEAWMVGGCVRDLLLERRVHDLDFVVEEREGGEPSRFSNELARLTLAELRHFERFATFKISFPGEGAPEAVDVVTARRERYLVPGSLPVVEPGSIEDDLWRRDFSVNALACRIDGSALADPTGGVRDLRERTIRILHPGSFIDDPTRLFRAVRLGIRLGFVMDPETVTLFSEAIERGALHTVSRERIWRELDFAIDEEAAPEILAELTNRGCLRDFAGIGEIGLPLARSLSVAALLGANRRSVALATIGVSEIAFEGSGIRRRTIDEIVQIAQAAPRLGRKIAAASRLRAFLLCERSSRVALSVAAAAVPEAESHVRAWGEFDRSVELPRDAVPREAGRHFRAIRRQLRARLFCGDISLGEAHNFAKEKMFRYLQRSTRTR